MMTAPMHVCMHTRKQKNIRHQTYLNTHAQMHARIDLYKLV